MIVILYNKNIIFPIKFVKLFEKWASFKITVSRELSVK